MLTLPGFKVEVVEQIDSTNSELMRRARVGQLDPTLLVAERQTAGRGRMGRLWNSEVGAGGSSLTCSLGLPLARHDLSGLSLAVGVALAQSLHPDLRLKWPNDLWLHDRKMAGILIEVATFDKVRYVVIGMGINLLKPAAVALATAPAWLAELMPEIDRAQTLQRVMPALVQALQTFEAQGFAPFRPKFIALDALQDREVSLSDNTRGVARGVDASGALLVHTSGGMKTIISSEISVRPLHHQPKESG